MSSRPRAPRLVCPADGIRLDRFLAEHAGPLSRRRAMAIISAGAVRVNGAPGRKGAILHAGDVVEVAADALDEPALEPETGLALPILYEDTALIAVDKPSGCPSVARRATDRGTVANFLLGYAPETAAAGRTPLEAGLVHRLDTDTSGVLLAARTPDAWSAVREQFRTRAVEKRYLAWVQGRVGEPGARREPIAHHPRTPRLMVACADPTRAARLRARPALTHYRPVRVTRTATLLEIGIVTGVRHQIRVHLAAAGHPVWGDPLYGSQPAARLMLHAAGLRLRHPTTGEPLMIESAPPRDFTAA